MEKEAVEKLVNEVISDHCKNDDLKHDHILKRIESSNELVRLLTIKVDPVVSAFNEYSTTGKITSKIVMTTAKIVISIGAIIGSIYAIKEWIKK